MGKAILIVLIIILVIIIFVISVVALFYLKAKRTIRNTARQFGFNNINNLADIKREVDQIKSQESERKRSVSGMTSLLLPQIVNDFPEFNENYIYNKTENSLRIIFDAINDLDPTELKKLPLLKEGLEKTIEDYKSNGIIVKYSDIVFHDFAIKDYNKLNGVATVTVCSTLEYYYSKEHNSVTQSDNRYKKQTRYACKFIYIYDESKMKGSSKIFGMNCPNCGAAIRVLGHKYCEYCGSQIGEINLKAWEFSSYNEY